MAVYTDISDLMTQVDEWRNKGRRIVFTNGCFDLIHLGHLQYLTEAAGLGDHLIVGVNSDASIARLKGSNRPIKDQVTRLSLIGSLQQVDASILFDQDTPLQLIQALKPDILVKGGDYQVDQVVGSDFVKEHGGTVEILSFLPGHSTTALVQKIIDSH